MLPAKLNLTARADAVLQVPFSLWDAGLETDITDLTPRAKLRLAPDVASDAADAQPTVRVINASRGAGQVTFPTGNPPGVYWWTLDLAHGDGRIEPILAGRMEIIGHIGA